MAKLGTWSTFGAPTKEMSPQSVKAMTWLNSKLEPIGASAFFKHNPHDFGTYLSIEVNAPHDFQYFQEEYAEDNEILEHEELVEKLNEIDTQFHDKFIN